MLRRAFQAAGSAHRATQAARRRTASRAGFGLIAAPYYLLHQLFRAGQTAPSLWLNRLVLRHIKVQDQGGRGRTSMQIKILDPRLHDWGLPRYQSQGAAAIDLFACVSDVVDVMPQAPAILVASGIALSFGDMSLAGLVMPRSGLGHKTGLVLGNSIGLIDPDYTGEILISVWNRNPPGTPPITLRPGERIAQMIFVPISRPSFQLVDNFTDQPTRGAAGFGSTGI